MSVINCWIFSLAQFQQRGPHVNHMGRPAIDLAVPLPGFVKRRAEDKIMEAALRRFKMEVERVAVGG